MEKTKFDSFCINGFAQGCGLCVQGKKLVLFVTGKCSRACEYCSLSDKRKNKDVVWANERLCSNVQDVLEESKASKACGAGITGGDPLIVPDRTLKFVKALKKEFGKKFHIHIYLPTNLVTEDKLKKLKQAGIDEVRFHPRLDEDFCKSVEKIRLATNFWPRESIGIEIPAFPSKKKEIFDFILQVSGFIGLVNLNELEISDTNFKHITKKYEINEDTYTIKGSKEAGLWILKQIDKSKLNLRAHLCTARTKNLFQYKNRLKLRDILPFGFKTKEGSVRYFAIYLKNLKRTEVSKMVSKFKGNCFVDKKKNRIILSEKCVRKALQLGYNVERVEELPTWDAIELEREVI
jgi:uncharacterized protein